MNSKTELLIHINNELLNKLQMYSDLYAMSVEDIVNYVLTDFVKKPVLDKTMQTNLARGYQTMAQINTQISSEFAICECEVDVKINK